MNRYKSIFTVSIVLFFITFAASAEQLGRDAMSHAGANIPAPGSASWTEATLAQKSAISYIDSNRWETKQTMNHNQTDYQMYRFNVMRAVNDITNLTATWVGYGENTTNYDVYLYIWNIYSNSWEQLDVKHLTSDGTLNSSLTSNIGNYVDTSGFVYIAAGAKHYNYAPPAPSGLSSSDDGYSVTISWSPVTDLDGDTVQYYAEVIGVGNSGWINTTNWTTGGITTQHHYTYRVKARDTFANAESPFASGSFFSKSSCPFVYGWNGSEYEYLTDLEGQVLGAPFFKVKDYRAGLYDIGTLKPDNGSYKIKIRETIAETDYFDEAKLWEVSVPQGYEVYTDWHDVYIPGLPVTYNLYTVKNPKKPVSAYDRFGRDVTWNLQKVDDRPVIETLDDPNYYTLDFGNVAHPEYAKLIVYGWNAFLKRKGDIDPYKNTASYHEQNTIIEVINQSGDWQEVKEFGRLAGDLKPVVFNISNIWLTDDHRIRIRPAYSKFATMVLDKIELDDSKPVPVEVKVVEPTYAYLNHAGSDSYIYPDLQHRLHAYDTAGNDSEQSYFYGNFTRYGDVLPLLGEADDMFVIMRHGDELKIEFPAVEEKEGSEKKIFLYADVYYSIKKTVDGTLLRDTVEPLPFHGMSRYPYNVSVENYPYDEVHLAYLKEWNTRVCEKGKTYCYDANTGEEIYNPSEIIRGNTSGKEEILRSLNTNFVELKVNNQIIGSTISNLSSAPALSGVIISWDNDVSSDNRVYYGLNEADVNNLVNGSWSQWNNNTMKARIALSDIAANTTYYYKPQSWYLGIVNNSMPARIIMALKPGVWTSPAEYMVSPPGWMSSPVNFRTVNISAAPLDSNGRYISGLSLEAVIYNSTGSEIGRANLSGNGIYSGNFTLPDYLNDGTYFIRIPDYPNGGNFSVLKWSCGKSNSCHAGLPFGGKYPSTFNAEIVHPRHIDTTLVYTIHPPPFEEDVPFPVTSTPECGHCHAPRYPYWVGHPSNYSCGSCHKSPSNTTAVLICEDCHNDHTTNNSVLSSRYGLDTHTNQTCSNCHGNLTLLNTKPDCTGCHPGQGSNLTAVPGSMENKTHSARQTVACGQCHNREHDIAGMTMDTQYCRNCHPGIAHDAGAQCTACHGSDPHNITFAGAETCTECHGINYTGANPLAKTTLVNISAFDESIHQNINSTPPASTGNTDCWACHYYKDMDRQNVKKCGDCHRKPSQWHGNANITTNLSELW